MHEEDHRDDEREQDDRSRHLARAPPRSRIGSAAEDLGDLAHQPGLDRGDDADQGDGDAGDVEDLGADLAPVVAEEDGTAARR